MRHRQQRQRKQQLGDLQFRSDAGAAEAGDRSSGKGRNRSAAGTHRQDQRDPRRHEKRRQEPPEDCRRGGEHSRRQAGGGSDQGRRRLQEAAGASCGVEPGQPDCGKRSSNRPSRRSKPVISSAPTSCCVRRRRRRSPLRRRRASSRSRRRRPRTRKCSALPVRLRPTATWR